MSSAYARVVIPLPASYWTRSAEYREYSDGAKTEPWGTPWYVGICLPLIRMLERLSSLAIRMVRSSGMALG